MITLNAILIIDKYQALFNYAKNQSDFPIKMTFAQIEKILSFPIAILFKV